MLEHLARAAWYSARKPGSFSHRRKVDSPTPVARAASWMVA
ncbi:MAG TPA: hypothetical protein VFA32_13110 [Dehalococcoidia bacterium]|nr:hypothetical protein [Dehalococcoidia bacterium]